jgi:photosystem II stability/assembly factor-like uncharacterized protein
MAITSEYGGHPFAGLVYISTDAGATWTATSSPHAYWRAVACSADGSKLVAASYGRVLTDPGAIGAVFTSTDSGATWTMTSAPNNSWSSVACSADGSKLIAAAYLYSDGSGDGRVYASNDAGNTWTAMTAPEANWGCLASSADGTRLAAAALGNRGLSPSGGVWTWAATTPPSLRINPSGTSLSISWPVSAGTFVLECSSALGQNASWSPFPLPAQTVGSQNVVTLEMTNRAQLFRLSK